MLPASRLSSVFEKWFVPRLNLVDPPLNFLCHQQCQAGNLVVLFFTVNVGPVVHAHPSFLQ